MPPWLSCAGSLYPNENPGTSPSVFDIDKLSPFPLLRRRSDGRDPRLQPTDEVVFVGSSSPPLPRILSAGSPPVERRLLSLLRGSQSMPRVLYMAAAVTKRVVTWLRAECRDLWWRHGHGHTQNRMVIVLGIFDLPAFLPTSHPRSQSILRYQW